MQKPFRYHYISDAHHCVVDAEDNLLLTIATVTVERKTQLGLTRELLEQRALALVDILNLSYIAEKIK